MQNPQDMFLVSNELYYFHNRKITFSIMENALWFFFFWQVCTLPLEVVMRADWFLGLRGTWAQCREHGDLWAPSHCALTPPCLPKFPSPHLYGGGENAHLDCAQESMRPKEDNELHVSYRQCHLGFQHKAFTTLSGKTGNRSSPAFANNNFHQHDVFKKN